MNTFRPLRVSFLVDGGVERLCAEPVRGWPSSGQLRILNAPFFAYGVSWGDVVSVGARDEAGSFPFLEVVRHSGHSTYRIFSELDAEESRLREAWAPLERQGCTFEAAGPSLQGLLAVDVPSEVDIFTVERLLRAGSRTRLWEFEEGHCAHHREN
ncbi:MAG: DUF4265 domain-containing protein [Acidobacteriota bacterium]